jgi:glycogen(starch) synthase
MSPSPQSRRPPTPFEAASNFAPVPYEPSSGAFLIEISWEVCNQIGGIYQVVRSKAPLMVHRWREQYCMLGPYIEGKVSLEFEASRPTGWLARLLDALAHEGLRVHHGHWLIQGRPRVLLLEHKYLAPQLQSLQQALKSEHGIELTPNEQVVDEALLFGEAVRRTLTAAAGVLSLGNHHNTGAALGAEETLPTQLLAHFHEWQGAVALPYLRRAGLRIGTLFTTHATQLGRYIAPNEPDFYDRLNTLDPDTEALHYNVRAQHDIERACAQHAHVFTTVSQITAEECAALLGRKPDLITPNGLTISRFNVGHDLQTFHADFKQRIHTFTMGYFFPHQRFDLDRTLYLFTSGRFEPRNKGFDLCLEALARLNTQLKLTRTGITVVFFVIASRPVRSIHPLALEKRGILNELRDVCDNIMERVGESLFQRAAAGGKLSLDNLVEDYWQLRYRRTQAALRTDTLPPIVTHILEDDRSDPVLIQLRRLQLFNRPDDAVKVVYHPEFIAPVNPLWGIEYEQFVRGCHLGVFPSAYEPWGYTPLECMALGTPAISSDLAGFGRYVDEVLPDHDRWGVWVLPRRSRTFEDAAEDLAKRLFEFCLLTRRERVSLRNEVEKRSWEFDWSRLGTAYHQAHDLALERLREVDGVRHHVWP